MKRILFDLDGTLTDPIVGVASCIRHALEKLQVECPAELDWCIGPPIHKTFERLLGGTSQLDKALELYRRRYAEVGIFENKVYPGIRELLGGFDPSDFELFVATSKPEMFARQVLQHFKLDHHFVQIYGSEFDGTRSEKAELINYILNDLRGPVDQFTMVGDREYDLIGANRNGIAGIGVLWGYGSREELEAVPSFGICESPDDLVKLLG